MRRLLFIFMHLIIRMLYGITHLQKILETHDVKHVLDIGAGKGYMSLFASSYGAQVDAVEPNKMKKRQFPTFLGKHPNIKHHNMPIEEFIINKQYDLIIITRVIIFLDRTYFLEELFPHLIQSMNPGGIIMLTYLDASDKTIKHSTQYELDDFTQFPNLQLIQHAEKTYTENHPPMGKHTHHSHLVVLKKVAI